MEKEDGEENEVFLLGLFGLDVVIGKTQWFAKWRAISSTFLRVAQKINTLDGRSIRSKLDDILGKKDDDVCWPPFAFAFAFTFTDGLSVGDDGPPCDDGGDWEEDEGHKPASFKTAGA